MLDLDVDRPDVLACRRGNLLDALESLNGFLDPHADRFLHLRRCRPGVDDGDADHVGRKLREDFHPKLRNGERTYAEDQEHKQV